MALVIRSSAARLATGYVLLGIIALVLFALPLGYAWRAADNDTRLQILTEDSQRLGEVFNRKGPAGLADFINERVGLQIAGERILLLTDAAEKPLAGNLPAWPAGVPEEPGRYTTPIVLDHHPTLVTLVRTELPGGYKLLVGRDVARLAPVMTRFWYGLAAAIGVLLVTGVVGGILIRRALLFRIHSIRQTVSAIMHGELSHRLPTGGSSDELNTLSLTINRMLEQIELLVNGIANVSNAIAHDLRTPLTELRSRLEELSLTRPPAAEAFAEVDAAVADVDRVISIFNALLRLAEIDTGMRRSGFIDVDLGELCARAVEFYVPAAELKDITLTYHDEAGHLHVSGDQLLLAQAINNLIDNALKYTPPGGTVTVSTVRPGGDAAGLVVADTGPGMTAAQRGRAAERFFRGDASRGTPGVGLGLSLVEAVARLHGGTLEFAEQQPGLVATISLPRGPGAKAG
jgi:signal transduction histidine kinase